MMIIEVINFRTDDGCEVRLRRDLDDPNVWNGSLCTPADPKGELWRVYQCELDEALKVVFGNYRRWIEGRSRRK